MELSIYQSDILIVDSHFAKEEIKSILKLNSKLIYAIYLGINDKYLGKFKSLDYLTNFDYKDDYILSVISCVRYHNIINMLKAYKSLISDKKSTIKMCLIMQILDEEYYKEIKNFIENNFKKGMVVIFSNINNKYLKNLYANSKLYLFSSYCEVFGLTSLEAMSQGCPVLVSNRSALPEINGEAAEYFDPDIPEDLKTKIKDLIFNQDKRINS